MKLEDIVGMELTHKKFGKVPVVDLSIDYSNLASTKFKVKLNNRYALFSIDSLLKFFTDVPKDILDDVSEISSRNIVEENLSDFNNEEKEKLEYINYNEQGEELTIDDWNISKKFIVDRWWIANKYPTPVVMDNRLLFISAKAACKYIGIDISNYYEIYSVCNGSSLSKTFNASYWRFAKIEDIDEVIDNYGK